MGNTILEFVLNRIVLIKLSAACVERKRQCSEKDDLYIRRVTLL